MNNVLLSFKRKRLFNFFLNKEIELDFKTATTNISIFGGTGVGKTTSICYPLLHNLVDKKCSGLVLDVKGDYSNIARNINLNNKSDKPFLLLGIKEDCEEFNIISGIDSVKLRIYLKESLYEPESDNNSYWGMNGIEDTILIYEILKKINDKHNPTLADLYYFLVNNNHLNILVKKIFELDNKLYQKILQRVFTDQFSVFNFESDSNYINEQRTWQLSKILKNLKPFYEDDLLRQQFCNNKNVINYSKIIYKDKKIFTIELPITKYNESAIFCLKILKSIFIDTIRKQNIDILKMVGYGKNKFTFLLIDEYQQFINPTSSPSMNDNNWFDISRGYGHINIISTQSIDSLVAKSNESHVNQLIGNTRNIIHMSTNAIKSLEHISILSSVKIMKNLLLQKEDQAYIYIGKNQTTRKGVSGKILTGKSKHKRMNYFINNVVKYIEVMNKSISNIEPYNENQFINKEEIFDINDIREKQKVEYINTGNNLWKRTKNPINIIDKKVCIITSRSESSGFKDFNITINKLGIEFKEVNVYSVIYNNKLSIDIYRNKDTRSIFKKDCLILYIRGGGDMENCFLNESNHIEKIKESIVNKNITIGIGYGHADDHFQMVDEGICKIWDITPTSLAYKIKEYYLNNE